MGLRTDLEAGWVSGLIWTGREKRISLTTWGFETQGVQSKASGYTD
jgi:hypothetical protein